MQPRPIATNIEEATKTYGKYNTTAARVLGALQMSSAGVFIVFNICASVYDDNFAVVLGIWAVPWFIGGAFGHASSFRKTKCLIITTMVMSIISASLMLIIVSLTPMQMSIVSHDDYFDCAYEDDCSCPGRNKKSGLIDCKEKYKTILAYELAMFSMMIVTAVVEAIVAIVTAAVCCRAVCCCRQNYSTLQEEGTPSSVSITVEDAQDVNTQEDNTIVRQDAIGQQAVNEMKENVSSTENEPDAYQLRAVTTDYQRF